MSRTPAADIQSSKEDAQFSSNERLTLGNTWAEKHCCVNPWLHNMEVKTNKQKRQEPKPLPKGLITIKVSRKLDKQSSNSKNASYESFSESALEVLFLTYK